MRSRLERLILKVERQNLSLFFFVTTTYRTVTVAQVATESLPAAAPSPLRQTETM